MDVKGPFRALAQALA